jgi:hypothetical protein
VRFDPNPPPNPKGLVARHFYAQDKMWQPTNTDEFERAVSEGVLQERHDFDAKRELPNSGKELAKDIAAMTTDGGCLVYGVGEDDIGRPCLLMPFSLENAAERIDHIAQQSVTPSPRLDFIPLRCADDQALGYLIVVIPPSPWAPHQVTVGNDRRFYGGSDTGNRRLTEVEVGRLYERRQRQSVDRERLLAECIASSPIGQPTPGEQGFLQAFVQPALRDDDLWDRATASFDDERQLLDHLRTTPSSVPSKQWGTNLGKILNWRQRGADKWSLNTASQVSDPSAVEPEDEIVADLSMDGRCYLFYGGAAVTSDRNNARRPIFALYERGIAVNLAQFLALVGAYYRAGDQWGPVHVGMAVTGIKGAVSSHFMEDISMVAQPYGDDVAVRTLPFDARDLEADPIAASRKLMDRLMRAMSGGIAWDPLGD